MLLKLPHFTLLLAEVEEVINQQICKQIQRIPVKATNEATKTAADLAYNDFCAHDFQYSTMTIWRIHMQAQ